MFALACIAIWCIGFLSWSGIITYGVVASGPPFKEERALAKFFRFCFWPLFAAIGVLLVSVFLTVALVLSPIVGLLSLVD